MRKIRILALALLVVCLALAFAACGGSVKFKLNFVVDGKVYDTVDTAGQEAIALPENPTKEGDEFDGWYWDEGEWNKPFTANSLLDAPLSSDMNVYAKWKSDAKKSPEATTGNSDPVVIVVPGDDKVQFHLNFVVDGAVFGTVDTAGNAVVSLPQNPVKEHYTFDGWFWDNGTWERPFTANSLLDAPLSSDMNVYAKWSAIDRYPITYVLNGGTNNENNPATYTVEDAVTLVAPTRTGYTFAGWSDGGIIAAGSTGAKTFAASWTVVDYPITYVLDGGTNDESNPAIYTVEDAVALGAPTRADYFFSGWTWDGQNTPQASVTIPAGSTGAKTFVANWYKKQFTGLSFADAEFVYDGEPKSLALVGAPAGATVEYSGNGQIAAGTYTVTATVSMEGYETKTLTAILKILNASFAAELVSAQGFGFDGTTMSLAVPNETDSFSFLNRITVTEGATWQVSTDEFGLYCSLTKSVPLIEGDNTFYLFVISQDGTEMTSYTVLIHRRPILYVTNGLLTNVSEAFKQNPGSKLDLSPYFDEEPITEIGNDVFRDCINLTAVTIPDGVTDIGNSAFYNCSGLTSVTIPDSVTSIGSYAFRGCSSLTSLAIPDSVTSIGNYAFYGCSSLTEITLPDGVTNIGDDAFYGCSSLTSITIPDSVTSIGNYAFYGCSSLTETTLPDGVTNIGDFAFTNCLSLQALVISSGVTSIPDGLLSGCSSLVSLTIPFVDTDLFGRFFGTKSFPGGTAITQNSSTYYVPSSLRSVVVSGDSVPRYAFSGCSMLTSVTIGNGVTSIGIYAFSDCSGLTSVTLGNSITVIGGSAFFDCSSLTSVYYTGDVAGWCGIKFENSAANPLYYAHDLYLNGVLLTELVIPDTVTAVNAYTFSGCSSLTSVTIPDCITAIGYASFSGCSQLESITIPFIGTEAGKTASDYYQYPFGYIFGTSSYTGGVATTQYYYGNRTSSTTNSTYYIPSSLRSVTVLGGNILYGAFYGCSNLTSVIIGNDVKSIGERAFYNCRRLTSITIGNGVTSIGNNAFYDSYKLIEICNLSALNITANGSKNGDIGYYAKHIYKSGESYLHKTDDGYLFYEDDDEVYLVAYCGTDTKLTLPDDYNGKDYDIYQYAFHFCSSLTSVIIPDNITAIGDYAFYACSGLTSLTIGSCVTSIGRSALFGCSSLQYNTYENGIYLGNADNPYVVLMRACDTSIPSCRIHENTKVIYESAFEWCSSLTSITIPDNVTNIGENAFYGCSRLTAVYINSISSWCGRSFGNSSANPLTVAHDLYLNDVLILLADLIVPEGVTSIGDYSFYGCSSLISVTIPDSVTAIGSSAFYGCSNLTSITIPDGVTSIGDSAFVGCSNLTSITVPDSVISIGDGAFAGCSSLVSLTIPFVGTDPFGRFFGTKSFPGGTAITQNSSTYYVPSSLRSVVVSDGSVPCYAFWGCSMLTSVTIGNGITSIGYDAFSGCSNLTSVYYTGDIAGWCGISFGSDNSNPLYYVHNLYLNDTLLTELVIPDTVTAVKAYAFSGCSGLTSVTIPDSVTSIGQSAFRNCSNLTSVTIGNGVTSIGDEAFENCSSLTSVTIPDGVMSIGRSAFYGCSGLTTATIPAFAISYLPKSQLKSVVINGETIPNNAFSGCSELTSVTIGNGVTSIGRYAFYNCSELTSVTLGNSITAIGDSAFFDCSSLTSVYYMGDVAGWCGISFGSDNANPLYYAHDLYLNGVLLTELVIPDTVTAIDAFAFSYCSGLMTATIPAFAISYLPKSQLKSVIITSGEIIPNDAFSGCSNLTSVIISDSVTAIGSSAFYGCSNLTSITVPDGVTSIGNYAFSGCSNLTSITIPDGVISIGDGAFADCSSLTSLTIPLVGTEPFNRFFGKNSFPSGTAITQSSFTYYIPSSLRSVVVSNGSIPSYAFSNFSMLTSVTIGNAVTSIEHTAFSGCTGLTSVTIGNSVTSIGGYAFYGCSRLTSIIIPDGVTSIGGDAFYGCSSLTSVTIGKGVTSIGGYAFYGCSKLTAIYYTGDIAGWCGISFGSDNANPLYYAHNLYLNDTLLTELVIPDTVSAIKDFAFYGCYNLTSVTILDGVTGIGGRAFRGCSTLASITIPDGITGIGDGAFYGCTALTSVTIPDGVTSIGNEVFRGCSALTSVTIPDSVTSIGNYAFYGCSRLTSIIIPDGVTSIGDNAFHGCYKLIEVRNLSALNFTAGSDGNGSVGYYAKHVYKDGESYLHQTDEGYLFYDDGTDVYLVAYVGTDTELTLPDDYNGNNYAIYQYAFHFCSSLTSVIIPDNITAIGDYAFYACSGLTSVTIGNGVTSIGNYAFYNCYKLLEVHNLSAMDITMGSFENGFVGYRAKHVYTNGESYLHKTDDGYLFYENGDEVYLVAYVGTDTELTLPDHYNGKNYAIYQYAFYNCTALTSVIIPEGVTSIGDNAFYGCSVLTSITIGNDVTSIGGNAFYGCSALASVTIGNSVTSIGRYAFCGCFGLKAVYVNDVAGWCGIEFSSDDANPLYYAHKFYLNGVLLTELVIPDTVTAINDGAFFNCSSLTEIVIPDSVTSIGQSAFRNCSNLTSVVLGNGITSIENYAFSGCSSLTEIVIPDSVTAIGSSAFSGCSQLESITIPFIGAEAGKTASDTYQYPFGYIFGTSSYTGGVATTQYYFGNSTSSTTISTFYIPSSLRSVTITGGYVPCYAFENCSGLTSVVLGNGVTSIGNYAFSGCSNLTEIVIPDSVTSIGDCAFNWCTALSSVTWNAVNCTAAGSYSNPIFSECSNLTSVTFGDNVALIPAYAFSGCSSLTSVYYTGNIAGWCGIEFGNSAANPLYYAHDLYLNGVLLTELVIPDTVTAVNAYTFSGCSSLTSVTIPDSVTSIGNYAFYNCSNLTSVTIPDSVTSIGSGAFSGCSSLTSVVLGNGVTNVGKWAFYNCGALASVYYTGDVAGWCGIEFGSYDASPLHCSYTLYLDGVLLTELVIPDTVTAINNYAFFRCSSLTSITIPDSVTSIGDFALRECTVLTSITFTGTKSQWNEISKGDSWNYNTGSYTIHCTDGDIAK